MDMTSILAIAGAVLAAAILVLRVIAVKTATDKDDKVLSLLEKIAVFFGKKPE